MPVAAFQELQHYVGFGPADGDALRALHPGLSSHFPAVAEVFYARILEHPAARMVLEQGESSVGRLKVKLVAWMEGLFQGPWDAEYVQRRALIGRVHVRIGLPQHYMFGAMNVLRLELSDRVDALLVPGTSSHRAAQAALSRILDLELAIMLQTYREDLEAKQARTERLSTFGQLVASIGHELRNPLGVAETSVYLLEKRLGEDPGARKHVARIGEQIALANGIIGALLDLVRDRPLEDERLPLEQVIRAAVDSVQRPGAVTVDLRLAEGLAVRGDAAQLRQAFVNLVQNAVEACGEQGYVRVSTRSTDDVVETIVEDTGPGIDPAVRARLFEPLVTTKSKGIGLGLALVRRIAERHGGTVVSVQGANGTFIFSLPRVTT